MRHPAINPTFVIIISTLSFAMTAIFITLAHPTPPSIIAFYYVLFVIIILTPIIFIKYIPSIQLLTKGNILLAMVAGFLLACFLIIMFQSLKYTTVNRFVFIMALQPIVTFIGSYFTMKERFSVATMISIFIALFGLFIIGYNDFKLNHTYFIGNLLALLSVIVFTIYYLTSQSLRRSLHLVPLLFIILINSLFFLLIYNIVTKQSFTVATNMNWLFLILLAIVPTFFGLLTRPWTIKWLRPSIRLIATIFEPIIASLFAAFLLREQINPFQWSGSAFIVFGLFLFHMSTMRKRQVTISK